MAKKTYVSVKCGLIRDPKHRQAMGECVWLFLYMIDKVDWDTGIIPEWKDESAAEDMGMPVRTLREQRRKLDELEYIACKQKQYAQEITIHNWTSPREYSGEVKNQKQGYVPTSPQDYTQGDIQGYIQGSTRNGTPTYSSKNQQTKDSIKTSDLDCFVSYFGLFLSEKEMSRWSTLCDAMGSSAADVAEWAFKKEIHLENRGGLLDSLETAAKNWKVRQSLVNQSQQNLPKGASVAASWLAKRKASVPNGN